MSITKTREVFSLPNVHYAYFENVDKDLKNYYIISNKTSTNKGKNTYKK